MLLKQSSGVMEPVLTEGQIRQAENPTPTPKESVHVLDAEPADAPEMASLGSKVFTESFGYSVPPDDLTNFLRTKYSAEAFGTEMRDPQTSTWTAKDAQGILLGFVQLVRGISDECLGSADPAELGHLHRLYVDTGVHGGGIGTRLMAAVEDRARSEGLKQLWLTVWEENQRARRLYERLGYRTVGKTDFVLGNCMQRDWAMVKDLN